MMRQKYVMANWKMNASISFIEEFFKIFFNHTLSAAAKCVIFPPAIYLQAVCQKIEDSSLMLGCQNVFYEDKGAFTGEVSSVMIKDFNCKYVLIGHSERRHIFNESEKFVAKKFHHVNDHGMIPVLCIGETLSERESNKTKEVLTRQLNAVFQNQNTFDSAVIAYEPVWAIGTGKTASAGEIEDAHGFIRSVIAQYNKNTADNISILYGGSVNEANAESIFNINDVDGSLIGGASLDPGKFAEIVKCIK